MYIVFTSSNGLFLDLLPKSKSIHFIKQPNNKNIATSRVFSDYDKYRSMIWRTLIQNPYL